jgi:hypothetical protein
MMRVDACLPDNHASGVLEIPGKQQTWHPVDFSGTAYEAVAFQGKLGLGIQAPAIHLGL